MKANIISDKVMDEFLGNLSQFNVLDEKYLAFIGNYSRNDDKRFKHADDIEETHVSEGDW